MYYKLILNNIGQNRVKAIKAICDLKECGLATAKNLAESVPVVLFDYMEEAEAVKACGILTDTGCDASITALVGEAAGAVIPDAQYSVFLQSVGAQSIVTIKEVREATGLGLREAKDLVLDAPQIIGTHFTLEQAEKICQTLTELGNTVSIQQNGQPLTSAANAQASVTPASYTSETGARRCPRCGGVNVFHAPDNFISKFKNMFSKNNYTKECGDCGNKW